jgi:uncharacterized protein (TIGR02598 family)
MTGVIGSASTQSVEPNFAAGFSLVEVTVSIGIIAFCLLAVVALLPSGLNSQQSAQDEARAASALNMVAAAAESLRFTSRSGGNATWTFPTYFSDDPTTPRTLYVTQPGWTFTFFIDEGGLIIPSSDTATAKRQTLHIRVYPPQIEGQPARIYAAVAWPYRATDTTSTTPDQMKGRAGFLDSSIAYTPQSSY